MRHAFGWLDVAVEQFPACIFNRNVVLTAAILTKYVACRVAQFPRRVDITR